MDRDEAIRKVQRCLALGNSPNEHEARTALMMARRMMAMYKIDEADIPKDDQEVVEIETMHTFSARRDKWIQFLSDIIAEAHCCRAFFRSEYRRQTRTVVITGFEEDVRISIAAMDLAMGVINSMTRGCSKIERSDYAIGFMIGMRKAYSDQDRTEEYGLVMTTPAEVEEKIKSMGHLKCDIDVFDSETYGRGLKDGRNHLSRSLESPVDVGGGA